MKTQNSNSKHFLEFRKGLGNQLQTLRKNKGLSQEELAAKINKDRVYIGYIEQGRRTPSLDTLYKIMDSLDSSMREIFDFWDYHR